MTSQSEIKSRGLASNLAVQMTIFVLVVAAAILLASKHLW
jgi:hypothetical protein